MEQVWGKNYKLIFLYYFNIEERHYIDEHATTAENLQHPHAAAMELFLSCGIVRLPKCSTECASGGFRTWLLE